MILLLNYNFPRLLFCSYCQFFLINFRHPEKNFVSLMFKIIVAFPSKKNNIKATEYLGFEQILGRISGTHFLSKFSG